MGDTGWGIIFVLGVVAAIAVVVVVAVWQSFAVARTKTAAEAELARDGAYRQLAERATAAQQGIAEDQQRIAGELTELRNRVTAIEKLLREVG